MKGGPSRAAARSGFAGVPKWGALTRKCPECGAGPGWRCHWIKGDQQVYRHAPHDERKDKRKPRGSDV